MVLRSAIFSASNKSGKNYTQKIGEWCINRPVSTGVKRCRQPTHQLICWLTGDATRSRQMCEGTLKYLQYGTSGSPSIVSTGMSPPTSAPSTTSNGGWWKTGYHLTSSATKLFLGRELVFYRHHQAASFGICRQSLLTRNTQIDKDYPTQPRIPSPIYQTWYFLTNLPEPTNHTQSSNRNNTDCFLTSKTSSIFCKGLLSSQFARIKLYWNCCILLYNSMREIDSHLAVARITVKIKYVILAESAWGPICQKWCGWWTSVVLNYCWILMERKSLGPISSQNELNRATAYLSCCKDGLLSSYCF